MDLRWRFAGISLKGSFTNNFNLNNTLINNKFVIADCDEKSNLNLNLCKVNSSETVVKDCTINILFYKLRSYNKIVCRFNNSQKSKFLFHRCYFGEEILFQKGILLPISN